MDEILKVINDFGGLDLTHYKRSSIERSVNRRVHACGIPTLSEYALFLQANASELQALISDVTVDFGLFFRDEKLFETLKQSILPEIIRQKKVSGEWPIRVWCAGCGAGEEAYSVAILLFESLKGLVHREEAIIFATDVDASSLTKSRAGIYSAETLHDVPDLARERYFSFDGSYRVKDFLKNLICFGRHDLLTNPPISHIDLLLCRNVLIYLDQGGQSILLRRLRYAVRPGGYLVLGKSESLSQEVSNSFIVVDRTFRTFQRKGDDTCPFSY